MSYDKRIVNRGPEIFVRESEAMGVRFILHGDTVDVYLNCRQLDAEHPLTVAANQPDVVNVLRERVTV